MASMPWRTARVVAIRNETPTAKTFRLALDAPSPHQAGQHYVVGLRAPDGYTASRSYSVASAPDGGAEVELTVERLDDGEVSTFLHDVVVPGDDLEVRGPIGGWFTWDATTPALLVGGGSGVVPLMAMLRLARAVGRADLVRLVVSVRTPADLYYADELAGPEVTVVHTRAVPPGCTRPPAHLGASDVAGPLADLVALGESGSDGVTGYVCGSTGFADAASAVLVAAGLPATRIRVERFGATDGGG
jgi:ferredoxin-NADP reductase